VLESANRIGSGVSSRNSEVVHAGFYYPSGSLKAKFCVEGRRAMYQFLPITTSPSRNAASSSSPPKRARSPPIEKYYKQGQINGVENARWISGAEARMLEPQLRCVRAVEYLESGVMDAHGYMDALEGEIEAHHGAVVLNSPFLGATPSAEGYDSARWRREPDDVTQRSS
jgi:L-2-hydroxyglutarate oxidase LhgO